MNVTSSDGTTAIAFTIGAHATWYNVTASSNQTPATLTITRVSDSCAIFGNCDNTFTLTATSPASTAAVEVVYSSSTTGSGITASVNQLNLTAANFQPSATSGVTLTNTTGVAQAVTISRPASDQWMIVSPSGSQVIAANGSLTLSVLGYAGNATDITYNSTITVAPGSTALSTLSIPVKFVVGSGAANGGGTTSSLTSYPTQLSLSAANQSLSGQYSLTITNPTSTDQTVTVTPSTQWLVVYQSGQQQTIAANSSITLTGYAYAGGVSNDTTYSGSITVTPTNTSVGTLTVPVTFVVGSGASNGGGGTVTGGAAYPGSLTFNYQLGGPQPPDQTVWVSGSDTYQITYSGRTAPVIGTLTAPGSFVVRPITAGAAAGSTPGSIVLTSTTTGASQTIQTNLLVSAAGTPVVNATTTNGSDIICTAAAGCTATINLAASDGSSINVGVATSTSWITLSTTPTSTPGSFTATLNPSGLSGVNTGSIVVTATGAANATLTIPVVLVLAGGSSSGGGLTLSASSVSIPGIGSGWAQQVSVTASAATSFTVSVPSSCSWLNVSPNGNLNTSTTGTLTLSAVSAPAAGQSNPCSVSVGTLSVQATYSAGGGGGGGGLTVSATTVSFQVQAGGAVQSQTVRVTGSGSGATAFTAAVSGNATGWLSVTPSSGSATSSSPVDLTLKADPARLNTGITYTGYVDVSVNGTAVARITVTAAVSAATGVSATPTSLTFNYEAGGTVPAPQQISVTGAASGLGFSATVTSGSDWLSVSPATGTTAAAASTVNVSVNPQNLQANKTFTGTIVIAGTGSATGSTTINVTINVTAPLPTVTRVTNAASFNSGQIAAGEIITIFGTAIGPATLTVASPTDGVFPTQLAGVQVTVGGYLCPIIYVRSDQVSVQVPYEINRPVFLANPALIVRFLGQSSNGVNLQQAAAAPGIFTTGGGTGQGAILNSNLSVNSHANPAAKGDVIVLYVTGEGQTSPAGATGKITSAPYPTPVSGVVTVTIGGQPAQVQFAGEAPGLISGALQVNAVIPTTLNITSATDLPVVVSVGGAHSQTDAQGNGAVTVAVH